MGRSSNQLYKKAGIITECQNKSNHKRSGPACTSCGYPQHTEKRHKLCTHSLRWCFRTQVTSQDVNPEVAEFLMGHKTRLYVDIRSKGPEYLRQEYMKTDFGITPKPKLRDRQIIEALLRGRGFNQAKILQEDAFDLRGFSAGDRERVETQRLADAFAKNLLQQSNIPSPCTN